jgi:murein DD-endopeptidase MepM/ murein hydrolase activator NlpD
MKRLIVLALALFASLPAAALELKLEGAVMQGALVIGRTAPNASVVQDGRSVRVGPDGRFMIAFGRDAASVSRLEVKAPDGESINRTLVVARRMWSLRRIDGLPPDQVTPPPDILARIQKENALVAEVRKRDTTDFGFPAKFVWPATGPISGVFGSQSILNGEGRAPHLGLDIAGPVGTPILSVADGTVTVAYDEMFLTGKTVVIDHGYGLNSSYLHMSELAVKVGDVVKQGQEIGKIGATGRVTGPHLHFGVNLFDIRLDPQLLLPDRPGVPPPAPVFGGGGS